MATIYALSELDMGAIHGKDRFKCDCCDQAFSWRLDLLHHRKNCLFQNDRKSSYKKEPRVYLLDACFLCGQQLLGIHSEEASFIMGKHALYYSNKPLAEVLEIITCDASVALQDDNTFALCKCCMNSVNKWDEINSQLESIVSSLRSTYRMLQRKKRKKCIVSKLPRSLHDVNLDEKPFNNSPLMDDKLEGDLEPMEGDSQTCSSFTEEHSQVKCKSEDGDPENVPKRFKCGCGKVAHGLDDLVDHQLRSGCKLKTNEYSCSYCGSTFNERKLLISHKKECIKSSMVNGAHECDICGRRFLVRGRVETHKRAVHGIGSTEQQLCCYCGKTFSSGYKMDHHLAKEHGIGHVKKPVVCTLCNKTFTEKSGYENHVKTKHQDHKFECEHCGKKYATRGIRNHHINEIHNISNKFLHVCKICGEQFNLIFKYRYHMRKVHSTVHHPCEHCGKTFAMSSDLYRHVRGVHMGIRERKRYPCKVCGRMFPSMYKVKRHATSHGIDSKPGGNSLDIQTKSTDTLEFHTKEPERVSPLIIHNENLVTGNLVKSIATSTLLHRKLGTVTSSLDEAIASSESGIAASLSETPIDNSDGTSIDIHQLPSADIYTTPHITTLTPEKLQGNITSDDVGSETMTVGPVSSIVVSASAVEECMNSEELQSSQPLEQLHGQGSITTCDLRRNTTLIQPILQSSLMPVQQMIVFEESVTDPQHHSFSVETSNQVISVSQGTNHNPVICIPHSSTHSSHTDQTQTSFLCRLHNTPDL